MKRLTVSILLGCFFVLFACVGCMRQTDSTHDNATEVLSKYGSTGTEVRNIQQKLKNLGYYTGSVDGIFGSKTKAAVLKFQKDYGLTQDGIVGKNTLKALGLSSSSSVSQTERNLLARVIYGEARGESYLGQVAVGAVILNRVRHPSFPNTIAGVIYQKGAFDAVADGQANLTPNETAYKAADAALSGWDPTGGCIYYYNPRTATNKWIRSLPVTTQIGNHVFSTG